MCFLFQPQNPYYESAKHIFLICCWVLLIFWYFNDSILLTQRLFRQIDTLTDYDLVTRISRKSLFLQVCNTKLVKQHKESNNVLVKRNRIDRNHRAKLLMTTHSTLCDLVSANLIINPHWFHSFEPNVIIYRLVDAFQGRQWVSMFHS